MSEQDEIKPGGGQGGEDYGNEGAGDAPDEPEDASQDRKTSDAGEAQTGFPVPESLPPDSRQRKVLELWSGQFSEATIPDETLKTDDGGEADDLAGCTFGQLSLEAGLFNQPGATLGETSLAGEAEAGATFDEATFDEAEPGENTFGTDSLNVVREESTVFNDEESAIQGLEKMTPPKGVTAALEPAGAVPETPSGKFRASGAIGKDKHDFEVVKLLAAGGMGEVMLANQVGLDRTVALKRPKQAILRSRSKLAGFLREATVNGDLEHPSIVPVYHSGIGDDGAPYYVMKLVKGIEWRYLLHPEKAVERKNSEFTETVRQKAESMTLNDHIEIMMKVCDAVGFAHSRGVLHRDLKPENVMVGDYGEVQVMDWGLAIDVSEKPQPECKAVSKANIRGPAGTPAYMAPEMALGDKEKLGIETDVYLLGAILYELLAGRPPHSGKSLNEVLVKAATNNPPDPKALNPNAPEGLAKIALKAMSTNPASRHGTVPEFQDEIREYLTHAQSIRISDNAERLLSKLTTQAPAAAGEQLDAGRYVKFAEVVATFRQALDMWAGNVAAEHGLRTSLEYFVGAALDGGDLGLARAQLDELKALVGEQHLSVQKLQERWQRLERARRARQRNFRIAVSSAAILLLTVIIGGTFSYFSIKDKKELAESNADEARRQQTIAEQNFNEAKKQQRKAEDNWKEALRQKKIAQDNFNEADKQRKLAEKNEKIAVSQKKFAEEQKTIAEKQKTIAENERTRAEENETKAVHQKRIADDQRQLAQENEKKAVEQKKIAEQQRLIAEKNLRRAITNLAEIDIQKATTLMNSDRDYPQAAVHLVKALDIMTDLDTTAPRRLIAQAFQFSPQLKETVSLPLQGKQVGFSPDGKPVVLLDDGSVWTPDLASTPAVGNTRNAKAMVTWKGGRVYCNWGGKLYRDGKPLELPELGDAGVISLAVDEGGEKLALGCLDGFLLVYDADDRPPIFVAEAHLPGVDAVEFRPGFNEIITTGADGRVCVWNYTGDEEHPVREVRAHAGYITALALSPNGKLAATAGEDGVVRVWDLATLTEQVSLTGHKREIGALAFHPTRPWLASHSWDKTIRVWDYSNPDDYKIAMLHIANSNNGLSLAFSTDGAELACLGDGATLKLWDMRFFKDVTPDSWLVDKIPGRRLFPLAAGSEIVAGSGEFWSFSPNKKPSHKKYAADLMLVKKIGPKPLMVLDRGIITWWGERKPAARIPAVIKAAAANNRRLAAAAADGRVYCFRINEKEITREAVIDAPGVTGITLSETGGVLAAWTEAGDLLSGTSGNLQPVPLPETFKVKTGLLSPDGSCFIYISNANEIRRLNLVSGESLQLLKGHRSKPVALALDSTGVWMVSGDESGSLRLWHLPTGRSVTVGEQLESPLMEIQMEPGGTSVACLLQNGALRRFNLRIPDPAAGVEQLRELVSEKLDIASRP